MANSFELNVGLEPWHLTVPTEHLVILRRDVVAPPTHSVAELTRNALEHPFGFEPLRRAVTPDDLLEDGRLPPFHEVSEELPVGQRPRHPHLEEDIEVSDRRARPNATHHLVPPVLS